MKHFDRHARRQVITRHQLVDIRPVAFEEVSRLFNVARERIEQLNLLVLVHTGDTGTPAAIIDGGDIFQPVQVAGSAWYMHFAQVVHRLVPILASRLFFLSLFVAGNIITDDDIVGILPHLERSPGRNLRVQRREAGSYVLARDIVGGQQDRVETETNLRLRATVGDTGIADELLFVEVIAKILRHPLHKVKIRAFDHNAFAVLTDTQKTHEAPHATHHIPGAASPSASTASGFRK